MDDIKKWRVENFNLGKRFRNINSWVANRAAEEYQADLFPVDDLRQREKVQERDATRTVREPVEYVQRGEDSGGSAEQEDGGTTSAPRWSKHSHIWAKGRR